MFDFDKLSQLEGFTTINNLCVVSGTEDELETHFVDVKEVFATSLENGYDLTGSNWSSNKH